LPTTSNDGYTGTWLPATVSNTATGTYTFTPDAGQCAKTTTLTVTVQEPFAFTIFGDCVANQFVLTVQTSDSNLDLSNAHFQWTNNNGTTVGNDSPTFNVSEYFSSNTPNLPAIFKVKVTSSAGCSLELPYTVEQVYCQIQKGISPNNDGLNDTFDLTGFNVEKLGIFNRYGAEVYTFGAGYTKQWFGQSKGGSELPDGTYFYVIELKGGDTKTGWVYISREK
ncbi:MAG: gliding motility-associated C-terminal domain-containing protein, partial [Flavobacterium sp.]|nr:gliding motility-associated C-terminal domain-containing protein [Flavobacterium sp.]